MPEGEKRRGGRLQQEPRNRVKIKVKIDDEEMGGRDCDVS